MNMRNVADDTVHKLPVDLKKALLTNKKALVAWEDITPLARNEWICWVITVKQQKTRDKHVKRAVKELSNGQRRPCCWYGCVHRTDKPISKSAQWVIDRKIKK